MRARPNGTLEPPGSRVDFPRIPFQNPLKDLSTYYLMRNLTSIVFALTIAFAGSLVTSAQEWTKFAPEGGRFEVMLPGTPQGTVETKDSEHGPYTTYTYILRSGDLVFLIGYADYDPAFNFDVKAEIAANKNNFLKGFPDSKLLTEKEISMNGSPGIEFTADLTDTRTSKSRVFVIGRRPYQLVAVSTKGTVESDALKFLDSFKLKKN